NRLPAYLSYCRSMPLLWWQPMLRRAGLSVAPSIITNMGSRLREFSRGEPGAVQTNLSTGQSFLVASENEWNALHQFAEMAPVCLSHLHRRPIQACMVGNKIYWNET